jgi:hypothetical protein
MPEYLEKRNGVIHHFILPGAAALIYKFVILTLR